MTGAQFNRALLLSSTVTLVLGFFIEPLWILSGLIGLVPAITWLINDLRHKTMGSDVLAVLALLGALFTDELFAAAVISVMLATGRVLESWAEGQAERQLKALLSRMPRNVHRVSQNGSIQEIDISEIVIGDKILIRSGEITPTDGKLLAGATLEW